MLDLLFRNITVTDGSGGPSYVGDVGVKDGKITFDTQQEAKEIVEGDGMTLCPGFVEAHSHGDMSIGFYPATICKIAQGITSEIGGQCGDGCFPVDKRFIADMKVFANMTHDYLHMPYETFTDLDNYIAYAETQKLAMNMATLIPHNNLRLSVMGVEDRAPTAGEMELMKERVRQCMEQGAFGLSTGLVYIPGVYADVEEIVELCKAMAPYGGIYATHMRDQADKMVDSVRESIYVAEKAGVALVISHFKATGKANWGQSKEAIKLIDEARARGVRILMDQYPYEAFMSGVSVCIPPWHFADGMDALLERLKEPAFREQVAREMNDPDSGYSNGYLHAGGFDGIFITFSPNEPAAEQKTIGDYARELGRDPMDVYFDLLIRNQGVFNGIFFAMDLQEVLDIYCNPHTVVGSDGLCFDVENKGHPRTWGTFVKTLDEFVGKRGLVTFEEAIKKQTSQTAEFWGLEGKGRIAEGYDADLVLIDRAKLKDNATFADPNRKPDGIEAVYVGGKCAYRDKELTGVYNGRMLRSKNGRR